MYLLDKVDYSQDNKIRPPSSPVSNKDKKDSNVASVSGAPAPNPVMEVEMKTIVESLEWHFFHYVNK